MSLYHSYYNETLIDQNVSASVTSDPFDIKEAIGVGLQVDTTNSSTPNLDFNIRASLDGVTWYQIDTVNVTADTTHLFTVTDAFYDYMDVQIVNNGGSADVVVKARAYARS